MDDGLHTNKRSMLSWDPFCISCGLQKSKNLGSQEGGDTIAVRELEGLRNSKARVLRPTVGSLSQCCPSVSSFHALMEKRKLPAHQLCQCRSTELAYVAGRSCLYGKRWWFHLLPMDCYTTQQRQAFMHFQVAFLCSKNTKCTSLNHVTC